MFGLKKTFEDMLNKRAGALAGKVAGVAIKLGKKAYEIYKQFTRSQLRFYKSSTCLCDPGTEAHGTDLCKGGFVKIDVDGEMHEEKGLETMQDCVHNHVTAHLETLGPDMIKRLTSDGFEMLCKATTTAVLGTTGIGSFAGMVACDLAGAQVDNIVAAFWKPEHANSDRAVMIKTIRELIPTFIVDSTFTGSVQEKKRMKRDFFSLRVCKG